MLEYNIYICDLFIAYNVSRSVSVVKFCKLVTTKIPYVYILTSEKGEFEKSTSEKDVRPYLVRFLSGANGNLSIFGQMMVLVSTTYGPGRVMEFVERSSQKPRGPTTTVSRTRRRQLYDVSILYILIIKFLCELFIGV